MTISNKGEIAGDITSMLLGLITAVSGASTMQKGAGITLVSTATGQIEISGAGFGIMVLGATETAVGIKISISASKKLGEDVGKGGSETVGEFEKRISKMSPNERVAAVKEKATKVAKENNLVKDSKLSKRNGRDIYKDPKTGDYYAVDSQHGRFEHLNKRGKHIGEVDFDFNSTKSADSSGGHDIYVK